MYTVPSPRNPVVLSYLALRKAVGAIALALPFMLVLTWWLLHREAESSISAYYYTGMRNLFVGSLCAVAMFMFGCRGYDRKDEIAGILSALLAVGVAFCPTTPEGAATTLLGVLHYIFAGVLFSTLAYFCLGLFKTTVKDKMPTPRKLQRNLVYSICGYVIIASIAAIAATKLFDSSDLTRSIHPVFFFETTALLAFGFAWLTKGETFLKDEESPMESRATDNVTLTFH